LRPQLLYYPPKSSKDSPRFAQPGLGLASSLLPTFSTHAASRIYISFDIV
jgi:hypothetical protein